MIIYNNYVYILYIIINYTATCILTKTNSEFCDKHPTFCFLLRFEYQRDGIYSRNEKGITRTLLMRVTRDGEYGA